ncbi:ubiquinone/menaquinone biosynthesis C-methylase UbiE [Nocardiopsis arvandica]|uniref:Ubiquinone/menaquinone biosynthesis C-methylase UbiE n=1 Tax=Nocardiopsis sinuspersici TaxID=501010 RepID=A0A7Z0BN52_9ACTN|nr:methyltransferase domain-containing protein [Nocardiopsis sinuspersici]NYH55217.1 ubiquinone/menaquinone biosynthesis C-methylase UbiE [Nocardiopsis sinuspersici]
MTRYTHGQHPSVTNSYRWRNADNSAAYALDEMVPGRFLLDVGCGPGSITADLARRVAPGTVTAVDSSAEAVDLARAAAREAGTDNVEFLVGDVHDLDLPSDAFDVVHAHQVLQHVADPVRALSEMRRVVRPGGVVAACDSDYSGMYWYPRLPELDAWMDLYQRIARRNGGEPDAGRRMQAWARQAGFTDVTYAAEVWSHSEPDRRAWWGGMWARRVLESDMGRQAVEEGHATRQELERISAGWTAWSQDPDGVFVIPRGAVLCRA